MSTLSDLEHFAVRVLPRALVQSLQQLKRGLPFHLQQTAPVVQMFVNDGITRSYVGVHNFFSCLLPELASGGAVTLTFYDENGRRLLRHRDRLSEFGARAVDVTALMAARRIEAPYGVVTAQLTPDHPRRAAYRDLGSYSAHFFVFFRDASGSVEQTHPLSNAGTYHSSGPRFISSQVVSTAGLDQIVLFQYNPGGVTRALEHQLLDLHDRRIVARATHTLSRLGSCRTTFRVADLVDRPAQLLVCVDPLPTPNAKPMLRRVFVGGLHSMSHA